MIVQQIRFGNMDKNLHWRASVTNSALYRVALVDEGQPGPQDGSDDWSFALYDGLTKQAPRSKPDTPLKEGEILFENMSALCEGARTRNLGLEANVLDPTYPLVMLPRGFGTEETANGKTIYRRPLGVDELRGFLAELDPERSESGDHYHSYFHDARQRGLVNALYP